MVDTSEESIKVDFLVPVDIKPSPTVSDGCYPTPVQQTSARPPFCCSQARGVGAYGSRILLILEGGYEPPEEVLEACHLRLDGSPKSLLESPLPRQGHV